MNPRKCQRCPGARGARARDDHLHDARGGSAREHSLPVFRKGVMRKIDADVYERIHLHGRCGGFGAGRCGMVWHA